MRTYIFIILLPITILFLSQCKSNKTVKHELPDNKAYTYNLEELINKEKYFNWNDIIDPKDIYVIPLENTEKAIIGNVHKIMVWNTKIFIHDFRFSKLSVFNIEGDFLFNIGKKGKGKGEYHELRDIDIQDDYIYILDYKNIIKYNSYDGSFIESHRLRNLREGFNPLNFIYYNDDLFYLWSSNPDVYNPKSIDYYRMHKYCENRKTEGYFKFKHRSSDANRFYKIHSTNNYFIRPVSGTYSIYKIINDSIKLSFRINMGKYTLPEDFFESSSKKGRILNKYLKNNYYKEIKNIFKISKKYIYFTCNGPRGYRYDGIVDQIEKKVIKFGREDFPYSPRIYYSDGKYFYGIYEPHFIQEELENSNVNNIIFKKVKNSNYSINKNDNPIIIKFRLKNKI